MLNRRAAMAIVTIVAATLLVSTAAFPATIDERIDKKISKTLERLERSGNPFETVDVILTFSGAVPANAENDIAGQSGKVKRKYESFR